MDRIERKTFNRRLVGEARKYLRFVRRDVRASFEKFDCDRNFNDLAKEWGR